MKHTIVKLHTDMNDLVSYFEGLKHPGTQYKQVAKDAEAEDVNVISVSTEFGFIHYFLTVNKDAPKDLLEEKMSYIENQIEAESKRKQEEMVLYGESPIKNPKGIFQK